MDPGTKLGHYEILEPLGAGGMGEVYRARDTKLDRDVAIKVLPEDFATDPERLARFEREAKSLAALDHPNIVTIHTVEEADGVHFLTMAYIEGRTLDRLIPPGGLPLELFLELAMPLADGLRAAHERGIIHRDLKPGNVMVDGEDRLRVLDFGLAKLQPEAASAEMSQLSTELMTQEGVVLGTYPYMSPEQAEGKTVDARSDIFSLGVVLYEMATGKRPFRGETAAAVVSSILKDTPPPVNEERPEVPRHLGRIIGRCLEKDPRRRAQSALDLRNELEALRKEVESRTLEHVTPGSVAAVPSARRPATRQRMVWAAGVVLVTLAVLAGFDVGGLRERLLGGPAGGQITSIAVLPLENMMGDAEQAYFVEGMHEALITELSKIGALTVISRTSAARYTDTDKSVPQIATELGVDAVIQGSVLRAGSTVRITVQLIEAATDRNLWADNFDRDLRDVLALHSDVARAVAREIKIAVTPEEEVRLTSAREVNPEAHRLYLLGQHHLWKLEPADFDKAIRYFQQAIELDPQYAQAHVGLATCYGAISFYGYLPPRDSYEKTRAALALALEIDSNLADAHGQYATLYFYFDWDWEKAEEKFQRAISLNSNYARAHQFYAWFLAAMGRTEEAHASISRALELDPLALLAYHTASDVFYFERQYDQAITQLQEVLDLSPNAAFALSRLGWSYVQKGMFKEAIGEMKRAVTLSPEATELSWMLGHAYAAAGQTDEARKILDDLHRLAKKQYVPPYGFAFIHTGLGENDEALEWLEKAYEERNGWMPFLQVEPRFDPLRSDPRFQDLLRRMNFPE